VPRTRAPGRLHDILDAAREVFSTVGYRRARMQEVAEAAGVSPGLLYTYVSGKEALFSLVIQREAGVDVDELALPVPAPDDLDAIVDRTLRTTMQSPRLDAAEREPAADARAELAGVVEEAYDRLNRARFLVRLIERTALDWPELAERFYDRGRKQVVRRLGGYVASRVAAGAFRSVPDAEVAGRFILESVAWFANHRYGDYDGAAIDDDVARSTVVELVTHALVAP
jgi:AcrR family transcriptional regulator